ncbi:MAG: VTT domain-containing protein [Pseudomonadota bacterium]
MQHPPPTPAPPPDLEGQLSPDAELKGDLAKRGNSDWVRSIGLGIAFIVGVSALFWLSAQLIGLDENGILNQTLRSFADSNFALPVVALAFSLASLIGAPQFLLIAVTVAVFGSTTGFMFSVVATLVSATFNFHLARLLGAKWLQKRGWASVDKAMDMVGRNGFLASLVVRVVPSAPFIVVNMGLGLTKTSYTAFLAGTAIGILPKTALIAILGKVVEQAQKGDVSAILYLVLAAMLWFAAAFAAKYMLQRREQAKS